MHGLNRAKVLGLAVILLATLFSIARADPITYMGFEGFNLIRTDINTTVGLDTYSDWTTAYSHVISLGSQKYLAGLFVVWEDYYAGGAEGAYDARIVVNGNVVFTNTYSAGTSWTTRTAVIPLSGYYNTTFTIEIQFRNLDGDVDTDVNIKYDVVYFLNEDFPIKSKLAELKYIPPGADGTSTSLILNNTEVHLNQPLTLPEGTISFWLKWDGSRDVSISDNIGINSDGYLYVKNDDGTVYTLDGVPIPAGTYVPVYVAWRVGEGYIMLNTTKLTLNWNGNITITRVGSITNSTTTLVDEFKVWDYFIPSDQVLFESSIVSYEITVNGNRLKIQPEGGFSLPILEAIFLDSTLNPLNSTTLSRSSQSAVAPANTTFIGLEAGNIKRLYYLENLSEVKLAFPSDDVSSVSVVTIIVPSGYNLLEVWTLDGKLAFRYPVQKTTTFTAVSGAYYKFVAHGNNTEITVVRQVSSDLLSLEIPEISTAVYFNTTQERLEVTKDVVNGIAIATYIAPEPKNITAIFTIYAPNGTVLSNTTSVYYNVQYKQWVFSLPTEFAYATLTVKSNTYEATKTIAGALNKDSWFSEEMLPSGLALLLVGTFGIWMFNKKNSGYAPLGALLLLTISDYVGLVHMDADLYAVLIVMSVVGLYTSREG